MVNDYNIECSKLKKEQRAAVLSSVRRMSPEDRGRCSSAVCAILMEMPQLQKAETIFSYCPFGPETDVREFNRWAAEQGKRVAYPVTGRHGLMEAWVPADEDAWVEGRYGIPAPDTARSVRIAPEEIDAVIVPCAGFDTEKRRLGKGGGYYDRYLTKCVNAVFIAAAFETQKLDCVPCDGWDLPMDAVVTEAGIY